eukprot:PhF_6_TR9223/c0_g1_i5/m.14510
MSVSLARILCVTFLLLLPACYAKLPCDKKWKGPSDSNSLNDCDLQTYFADTYGVYVVAPIVLAILMFVVIPIILCARYCCNCCGGFRRSPNGGCCGGTTWNERQETEKNAHYLAVHVTGSKLAVGLVLILGIVGLACCVAGATTLQKAYDDTWSSTDNVITWLQGKVKSIRTKVTKPDGTYITGIDASYFDNVNKQIEDLRSSKSDLKDQASKIWDPVVQASFVLGVVPILMFVMGIVFALCNIRRCGPLSLIILAWIIGTLFWILAFGVGLTNVVLIEVCDEVDAQKTKSPGVMQWYAVPLCNKNVPLDSAKKSVVDAERQNAIAACNTVLSYCENSDVYNPAVNSQLVFYCPFAANTTASCPTFANAADQIGKFTRVKLSVPTSQCTDVNNANCTVSKCSQTCSNTDLKNAFASGLAILGDAGRALAAFNEDVAPMLDCNVLYDKAFEVFSECSQFVSSTTTVRAGLIIYAIASFLLAFVMMLGQKRFFPVAEAGSLQTVGTQPATTNGGVDGGANKEGQLPPSSSTEPVEMGQHAPKALPAGGSETQQHPPAPQS